MLALLAMLLLALLLLALLLLLLTLRLHTAAPAAVVVNVFVDLWLHANGLTLRRT